MSLSFWWNSEDFSQKVLSTQKMYSQVQFYIDSGDSGQSQDGKNQTVTVYQRLSQIGYNANESLSRKVVNGLKSIMYIKYKKGVNYFFGDRRMRNQFWRCLTVDEVQLYVFHPVSLGKKLGRKVVNPQT